MKGKKRATASPKRLEITWPHLAELARQSSIISRNVQPYDTDNNQQEDKKHDFVDGIISQSTSLNLDPVTTQTIISQQSFNSKVLRHYHYESSSECGSLQAYKPPGSTITSHRPYIPPYAMDSAQSSPRAAKRLTAHSDSPKSKKKRSDGTETSNSWQAEKIEDSVAYKVRAKRLWKQAQETPVQFQAVV